jgi:hypothetical protein
VRRIVVAVDWRADARLLSLHYRLDGDTGRLLLPAPAAPRRADGLWRHTCFEAFVRPAGGGGYCEFNFSPSGEWAAYRFTGRRAGMEALEGAAAPVVHCSRDSRCMEFSVTLDATAWAGPADLGLAAVIEERDGALTHWALSHLADRPDFHDPGSFTLRLGRARPLPLAGTT